MLIMLTQEVKYSPFWDGVEEQAELISSKNNQFVKFKWLEEDDIIILK